MLSKRKDFIVEGGEEVLLAGVCCFPQLKVLFSCATCTSFK